MTDEKREKSLEVLIAAGRVVLKQFQSGHHPTERQLNRLAGALCNFDAMRVCGHRMMDECDCFDAATPATWDSK